MHLNTLWCLSCWESVARGTPEFNADQMPSGNALKSRGSRCSGVWGGRWHRSPLPFLAPSASLSRLSPDPPSFPRRIKPPGLETFSMRLIWKHEWILCKYCTFTMRHCWNASWERQEKASFTADCKLKRTKLSHHLQHKPPHLFFTVQHHPAAHRPKTITQSLRLPAQDACWLFYRGIFTHKS